MQTHRSAGAYQEGCIKSNCDMNYFSPQHLSWLVWGIFHHVMQNAFSLDEADNCGDSKLLKLREMDYATIATLFK